MMKIPSMSRNHALLATAAAVILFAVAWRSFHKPAQAAARGAAQPIAVDMAAAAHSDVPIYLHGLGTVQAFYTVTVTAQVDGELQRVAFTEGQAVHKGDLLAQIDPPTIRPWPPGRRTRLSSRTRSATSSATRCCSPRISPASRPSTPSAPRSTS